VVCINAVDGIQQLRILLRLRFSPVEFETTLTLCPDAIVVGLVSRPKELSDGQLNEKKERNSNSELDCKQENREENRK
jgi:hypothetical protein